MPTRTTHTHAVFFACVRTVSTARVYPSLKYKLIRNELLQDNIGGGRCVAGKLRWLFHSYYYSRYTSLRHAEGRHRSGLISGDVKRGQIFEAEAEDNFPSP